MNANRKKAEALIYKFFDAADPTKANSNFYKEMFAKMSDQQFMEFCKRRLPFRLQTTAFDRETNPKKCIDALKAINVPVLEKVSFPSIYRNKDGVPVTNSNEAMVGYLNLKKLKQIVTKKSGYNTDINTRNPKTGAIVGNSKGVESDRELESLVLQNMNATIKEFTRAKADDMEAKNKMYNQINTTGQVSLKDLESDKSNQIARNTVDVYLIGSGIMSNLLEQDYMTPYTLSMKKMRIDKK
jgi:hypothetical protein